MIYEVKGTKAVVPLFQNWEETPIWSCLQGIMGTIYADDREAPTAAMAVLGDFAFLAGQPNLELASYRPAGHTKGVLFMVPQNEQWKDVIAAVYGEKTTVFSRYAIKKEPDVFDTQKLERAVASLPAGYKLCTIDEPLYRKCKAEDWSADFVSQFPDYESYRKLGLGVVICKDGVIVSGASSYSRYRDGIEMEIDTRETYRRKGLAYICGAKLILECLKRNLYPSWDAHTKISVALAEKLGYHYSHAYTAMAVRSDEVP